MCPSGFSFGLAFADLSVDVFPGWVVVSLLGDRGDVEDAVDASVAAEIEVVFHRETGSLGCAHLGSSGRCNI